MRKVVLACLFVALCGCSSPPPPTVSTTSTPASTQPSLVDKLAGFEKLSGEEREQVLNPLAEESGKPDLAKPEIQQALAQIIENDNLDEPWRVQAASILGGAEGDHAALFIKLFNDKEIPAELRAVALGQVPTKDLDGAFLEGLIASGQDKSEPNRVQSAVAVALRKSQQLPAIAALITMYEETERDRLVRLRAGVGLVDFIDADPSAVETLNNVVTDPNLDIRRELVEALTLCESDQAKPLLEVLTKDTDQGIAGAAQEALKSR